MSATFALRDAPPSARSVTRQTWRAEPLAPTPRLLAEEVAVAANYDGTIHAVLMMTPDDLDDFALGFSFTEGDHPRSGRDCRAGDVRLSRRIVLRMWLTGERSDAFEARRRRFIGPAGCGMCGLESLAEANRAIPTVRRGVRVGRDEIMDAVGALPGAQVLNRQTRSVHAAAFWQADHELLGREDVGRHNALDKLAGALLQAGRPADTGIVVLSSRVSIELMGVPILVGISAPTALAVRNAEEFGITLVGTARDDGFEVFSHP